MTLPGLVTLFTESEGFGKGDRWVGAKTKAAVFAPDAVAVVPVFGDLARMGWRESKPRGKGYELSRVQCTMRAWRRSMISSSPAAVEEGRRATDRGRAIRH